MKKAKESVEQPTPNNEKILTLQNAGFISGTMGQISESGNSLGLVLWARRPPDIGFELHLEISKYLRSKPLTILLDDVLPMAINGRSSEEQNEINMTYIDFFGSRDCRIELVSDIYAKRYQNKPFPALFKLSDRISLNDFIHLLPEKKEKVFDSLTFIELIHALNELHLFEILRERTDVIIIPHFSQAMSVVHRNICHNPLSVIITPTFGTSDEMKKEITRIKKLTRN